ncbi:MAG TPA: carbon storage regulator CsrA [Candidatus Krumholzibacteria bacterium]
MLVLSRKRNEKIIIGEDITVTVLEVRGDQVQLGIDAPRSIPVHRHEVYMAIHGAKAEDAREPEGSALPGAEGAPEEQPAPASPDEADAPPID